MSFSNGPRKASMRQGPKARAVALVALDGFEIARGVIVPAGRYDGWERKSRFNTLQSAKSANARYEIEFAAERLGGMDTKAKQGTAGLKYDVTQLVEEQILVVS